MLLLLGGVRSGKSALAVELARSYPRVTFLATAQPVDDDLRTRIARHRAERPAGWTTLEEPAALRAAIGRVGDEDCLVIDCLTVWAANRLLEATAPATVEEEARAAAGAAAARSGPTIVVGNEVGMGVHPASELGRTYRDLLGRVNTIWAAAAERSFLVVAGRLVELAPASGLRA